MSKYKIGDKFKVISSDMDSVKIGDILEFQYYYYYTDSSIFRASRWAIKDDLTMSGFPETKLQLLKENMCKFNVGDIVKLVSRTNNTALQIGDIGTIATLHTTDDTCRVKTDKISSGNWTKLSDLELVKRENTINEINIKVPEGYVIDEGNSSFTCIKFKKEEKKQVTCWEDLQDIKGFVPQAEPASNKLTFTTKEQAEACIALAMLSQLMKDVNGDWIPDWDYYNQSKHTISFYNSKIDTGVYTSTQRFLSFPTLEIRDTFLKNHEELIMKAKYLL